MATRKLEHSNWVAFFDRISQLTPGKRADIEIASLKLGSQIEAKWLPLVGLVYDPKDDALDVILEGVDHIIRKPREIYVDEAAGGLALESILVIDADDVRQIIKLRDPLMLPAPSTAAH